MSEQMEPVVTDDKTDVPPGGEVGVDFFEDLSDKKPTLSSVAKETEAPAEIATAKEVKETKSTQKKIEKVQEKAEEEGTTEEEQIKQIQALIGDKSQDLPADAKFKVKVDGKEIETTLDELMSNYSGKTAWDKKFNDLAEERKKVTETEQKAQAFLKDKEEINNFLNHLNELGSQGKSKEVFYELAQALGLNPVEYTRNLMKQYGIEDVEDESAYLKEEAEWRKKELERERGLRTKEEEQRRAEESIRAVQQKFGLTNSEFDAVYDDLKASGYEETITAESVGEHYVGLLNTAKIEKLVAEVAPEIDDTEKQDAITELKGVMKAYPDITTEELFEVASSVWGNEAAKKVSKKIYKTKPQSNTSVSPERKENPITFEDI